MSQAVLLENLRNIGIKDEKVLRLIASTPRELFVLDSDRAHAYENRALPIEEKQTISQPYIVARMTEALRGGRDLDKVLEIGTGSGYQAAILSQVAARVYSIERIKRLYEKALMRLEKLAFTNVFLRYGDGLSGWPDEAPFDGIIVTAAAKEIPKSLLTQLAENGTMVIPVEVAEGCQLLYRLKKRQGEIFAEILGSVIFVPLLEGVR